MNAVGYIILVGVILFALYQVVAIIKKLVERKKEKAKKKSDVELLENNDINKDKE